MECFSRGGYIITPLLSKAKGGRKKEEYQSENES
jgi:hypothetical protein